MCSCVSCLYISTFAWLHCVSETAVHVPNSDIPYCPIACYSGMGSAACGAWNDCKSSTVLLLIRRSSCSCQPWSRSLLLISVIISAPMAVSRRWRGYYVLFEFSDKGTCLFALLHANGPYKLFVLPARVAALITFSVLDINM